MKRFLRFLLATSSTNVLLVMGLSVAAGLCSALLIALIGNVFTNLHLGVHGYQVAAIVALVLLLTIFEYLAKFHLLNHSERVAHQFRQSFARWQISRPLAESESKGTAAPLATYSEDIKRVTLALEYLPELGVSLAAITGASVYLTWVSAPVMLGALIAVIPSAWVFVRIQLRVRNALLDMLSARDKSNGFFRTMLIGEKELKLNTQRSESIFEDHLGPSSYTLSGHAKRLALMYCVGTLWTQLCYFGAIIVVLLLLATGTVTGGVVAPYVLVALFLRSYIYRFMAGVPHWTAAGAVLDRLDKEGFGFLPNAPVKPNAPAILQNTAAPVIDVKSVCYEYVSEHDTALFTAGPFDLRVDKPEILFVTGQNGVGKSTFLKILCGLYTPKSGQILLNGEKINDENLDAYRANFSALFTVPHVFPEVPLNLPTDPARARRFEHYIKVLQLDGKIKLDRSAHISELSHGQTKRLALLLALVDDRPVVIFDEWAENQDPSYKKVFYYDILPELKASGRIVIAVTHESNYFDAADRIYTLTVNH